MQLIGSKSFVLAFVFLVLICHCGLCQVNSNLIEKLKRQNNGIQDSQSLVLNNISNKRVRRQYFKPPIDGTWFTSSNDKTVSLGAKTSRRETSTNEVKMESTPTLANNRTQKRDETTNNQVTVASLSISLINLFDRVKDTLCNLINTNCKQP